MCIPSPPRAPQGGMTLIEMIVFMVVVGVALAGIISVLNNAMRGGANMISQKQALAIAEAIIEEVALKPFTICDPDDPNAATAALATDCSAPAQNHEGTNRAAFDNVIDYAGYSFTSPIRDHSGTYAFPDGYTATVAVTGESLNGIASDQSLRITVTVSGPGSSAVTLDTYRTRYAPNFIN